MTKRGASHNIKAGAADNQFGVKLGDIRAIAKKLKTHHDLALKLGDTGNVEAQLLATLIINPTSLSAGDVDRLTRSTTCAQVAEWLNAYDRRATSREGGAAREVDEGQGWLGGARRLAAHGRPRQPERGRSRPPRPARPHRRRVAEGEAGKCSGR